MITTGYNRGKQLELYANNSNITLLTAKLDETLTALNGKIDKVRTTVSELGASMSAIVDKASTLQPRKDVIDASEITKLYTQMQTFNAKVEGVNKTLDQMVDEVNNPVDEKHKRLMDNFWRYSAIAMAILCTILLLVLIF